MKVTFVGTYSEVIRSVNAPETLNPEQNVRPQFGKLLGDLEPSEVQIPDTTREISQSSVKINSSLDDAMGRLSPSMYQQISPTEDLMLEPATVKTLASDLKTPTIVSAERIPPADAKSIKIQKSEIQSLIDKTGLQVGVDPLLAMSVAKSESSFNPNAVSSDGHASKGLFQLLDSTGKHLHSKLDLEQGYDPFNPGMNTELGVNYLRYLHDIFSTPTTLPNKLKTTAAENSSDLEKFAVAAFNAGEGRVASAQARAAKEGRNPAIFEQVQPYLPDITQTYVARVMRYRDQFEQQS
jgi:soluble lytic murein transglycosylase-like protein